MTDIPQKGESPRSIYLQTLGSAVFASGYIFGPMILFGGLGWWLGQVFGHDVIIFGGLFVGIIVSNYLIFKRLPENMKRMRQKMGLSNTDSEQESKHS